MAPDIMGVPRRASFRLILPDHSKTCDRCGQPIEPGEVMLAVPCDEADPEVRCYDVVHTPRCPGWTPRVIECAAASPLQHALPFLAAVPDSDDSTSEKD